MVGANYIPERGDIICLPFTATARKNYLVIVITPVVYNQLVGNAIVVSVTDIKKSNPFEIEIKGKNINGGEISGQIALADHLQIIDLQVGGSQPWEKWGTLDDSVLEQISEYVKTILGL